jgi:NAD(P)H-nitrite reductase large subunit
MASRRVNNYAIIGMGAAGVAAALAIRQKDLSGAVTLITNDPHHYYSRPGLAYVLASEIPQKQLFPFAGTLFRERQIRTLTEPVEKIDLASHRLTLGNRQQVSYDRLLIATGAAASLPDVPGIQFEGVVKMDTYEDAQAILGAVKKTKSAVVVGGGITALELVEGLAAHGVRTHYFLRGDRYWSVVLDEVESRIIERRLREDKVILHYHTDLVEVIGRKNRVVGVVAEENGQRIELDCQLLAAAIGIKPRIQLAAAAGLKTQRGILVDPSLQTSDPDVFAAGDVAQVFDRQKGEYLLDSLWGPALSMGRVAGANMAGGNAIYEKKFPFNVTRLAGLVTTIIGRVGKSDPAAGRPKGDQDVQGIMRGDSEVWRLQPEAVVAQSFEGDNRLRLYLNADRLVGAVIMGDQSLSLPVQNLIQQEIDIRPIRQQLLAPNADLASLIIDFWKVHSLAAKVA